MLTPDVSEGNRQPGNALGWPRKFLNNRFVYLVLSQRARGLSVGVNMNPDKRCNYKCIYCEVNRAEPARDGAVDLPVMTAELDAILRLAKEDKIRDLPGFSHWPAELLALKEVALSGDGEPTLSPQFKEIVASVVGLRSRGLVPFFKIVLITNTAGLHLPEVGKGLRYLTSQDEIWVKLDAGTQQYMDRVNVPDHRLSDVMANILTVALERPVVIQSLFPLIRGEEPSEAEIEQYVHRLQELTAAGAQIAMVQIYSAHRPSQFAECRHLPLQRLSHIARQVRTMTGLKAEVF
jgi:wyosine [tRNA(Phe)-imidazoG37] synthetase (radical SAM superfamily)